ncbi:MAG: hypothetical protein LBI74_10070, partial [Synergistaceae bacterium]|nr:hypothetical protein [Synergistaceae bacterium]
MNERVKAIYEDIWTLCSEAFEAAKIDTIIKDRALLKPKEFSILLSSDEYQASLDVYKTLYEYEMAGFLIYLGLSDGSMDEGELRFIREYDSICKNPKFANSLGQASVEVFSNSVRRIFDVNFYEKDVPYVFKTAAEADLTQGRAYGSASFSERLYDLFFQLGEEFLACSEEGGKKAHRFGACMDIIKTYVSTYAGSALPSGEAPMPDPEPPVPDPKSLMPDPEPLMPDTKS